MSAAQKKAFRKAIKKMDEARDALEDLIEHDATERDSRRRLCSDLSEYADYLERRLEAL